MCLQVSLQVSHFALCVCSCSKGAVDEVSHIVLMGVGSCRAVLYYALSEIFCYCLFICFYRRPDKPLAHSCCVGESIKNPTSCDQASDHKYHFVNLAN